MEKLPALICWEASDQHGNTKRHSRPEWRFVCLAALSARVRVPKRQGTDAASLDYPGLPDDLHGYASGCSIRVAYQAADANHPSMGSESSPLTGILRQPV